MSRTIPSDRPRSGDAGAGGGQDSPSAGPVPTRPDDPESPDALDQGTVSQRGRPAAERARRPRPRSARPRRRVNKARRLAAAGIVIVAAIGFLLYKGLTSAVEYFRTTNEALADRAQLGNSTFQLEGVVENGTVHQLSGGRVGFVVTSGPARIAVVNTGAPPQLFRAGIPVVVVGHFVGAGDGFASDQILVKHSNQYIAAHPSRVTVPPSSTAT